MALGLTGGEAFIVVFLVVAVVSASWWPKVGERLFAGKASAPADEARDPGDTTGPPAER